MLISPLCKAVPTKAFLIPISLIKGISSFVIPPPKIILSLNSSNLSRSSLLNPASVPTDEMSSNMISFGSILLKTSLNPSKSKSICLVYNSLFFTSMLTMILSLGYLSNIFSSSSTDSRVSVATIIL